MGVYPYKRSQDIAELGVIKPLYMQGIASENRKIKKPIKNSQIHPIKYIETIKIKVFAPDFQGRKEMPLCV